VASVMAKVRDAQVGNSLIQVGSIDSHGDGDANATLFISPFNMSGIKVIQVNVQAAVGVGPRHATKCSCVPWIGRPAAPGRKAALTLLQGKGEKPPGSLDCCAIAARTNTATDTTAKSANFA
jgi:hypothetical protein